MSSKKQRESNASPTPPAKKARTQESTKNSKFVDINAGVDIAPSELLDRVIKVWWPLDKVFYRGKVVAFNEETLEHKVLYDDDEHEQLFLVKEKVQLYRGADEMLQRPNMGYLLKVVEKLNCLIDEEEKELAALAEDRRSRSQAQAKKEEVRLLKKQLELVQAEVSKTVDFSGDSAQPGGLRGKDVAGEIRWAKALIEEPMELVFSGQALLPVVDCSLWPGAQEVQEQLLAAWEIHQEHKLQRRMYREIDVPLRMRPADAVGRKVEVYWPLDDAWYPGEVTGYEEEQGCHHVVYTDNHEEDLYLGIERVRVEMGVAEAFPGPDPNQLLRLADIYARQSKVLLGQLTSGVKDPLEEEELRDKVNKLERRSLVYKAIARWLDEGGHEADEDKGTDKEEKHEGSPHDHSPVPSPKTPCPEPPCHRGENEEAHKGKQVVGSNAAENDENTTSNGLPDSSPLSPGVMVKDSCPPVTSLLPGEVVWVRCKGWPLWPALIITSEEAGQKMKPPRFKAVSVKFFRVYDLGHHKLSDVVPFIVGVAHNLHAQTVPNIRKRQQVKGALAEALKYLETGELPEEMAGVDGVENEDMEAAVRGSPQATPIRSQSLPPAVSSPSMPMKNISFPLVLGKTLQLHAVGRIEWAHPLYHTDRHIFPVGYHAARLARTPASGREEVWHHMKILEGERGPRFEVSIEGGVTVTAESASRAWAKLYTEFGGNEDGTANRTGLQTFGLNHNLVRSLIQALPCSNYCEQFTDWEGQPPPKPVLTESERLRKMALEASLLQLPEGIQSLPITRMCVGVCDVCGEDVEYDGNHLLECDRCGVTVHMECCGVKAPPQGELWLCEVCQLRLRQPPPCALCPRRGRAVMKPTTDKRWCHVLCAIWIPETSLLDKETMGPVDGLKKIKPGRCKLVCSICKQPHGACVQCGADRHCTVAFHPMCAREAGLPMVISHEESPSPSDDATKSPGVEPFATEVGEANEGLEDEGRSVKQPDEEAGGAQDVKDEGGVAEREAMEVDLHPPGSDLETPTLLADGTAAAPTFGGEANAEAQSEGDVDQSAKQGTSKIGVSGDKPLSAEADGGTNVTPFVEADKQEEVQQSSKAMKVEGTLTMKAVAGGEQPADPGADPGVGNPHEDQDHNVGADSEEDEATSDAVSSSSASEDSSSDASEHAGPERAPESRVPSRRKRKTPREGTALGDGAALLCFCRRHANARLNIRYHQIHCRHDVTPSIYLQRSRARTLEGAPPTEEDVVMRLEDKFEKHTGAGLSAFIVAPQAASEDGTCARSRPFPPRNPDIHSDEAAQRMLQKRQHVCAIPYLTGSVQPPLAPLISKPWFIDPQEGLPEGPGACGDDLKAEPCLAGVECSLKAEQEVGPLVEESDSDSVAAVVAGLAGQFPPNTRGPLRDTWALSQLSGISWRGRGAGAHNMDDPGAGCEVPAGIVSDEVVLSRAERFVQMHRTLHLRVVAGKSSIHGLGAFARTPHRVGEMIMEYQGELIRQSVADVREHEEYDHHVGAGTYVFRLSEALFVDATRTGNMAHLVNHSCDPNCFSRTFTIRHPDTGKVEDHVVICALRDIAAGDELTYDYRFLGKERLVCNCGTGRCRGLVNAPDEVDLQRIRLPRRLVEKSRWGRLEKAKRGKKKRDPPMV